MMEGNCSNNNEVINLLQKWEMKEEVLTKFKEAEIDIAMLRILDEDCLKDLISSAGQRVRFRLQRKLWLKKYAQNNPTQNLCSTPPRDSPISIEFVDSNGNLMESLDGCFPSILMEEDVASIEKDGQLNTEKDVQLDTEKDLPLDIEKDREVSVTQTPQPPVSCQVSSPPSAKRAKKDKIYDLNAILQGSCEGKKVRAKYGLGAERFEGPRTLDRHHRDLLAKAIIEEEQKDDCSISLSYDRLDYLADCIVALFPTEQKETWITKTHCNQKTLLKGKLYVRYYNSRRAYRKSGLLSSNPKKTSESGVNISHVEPDDEMNGDLLWLESNAAPFHTVSQFWRKTTQIRLSQLRQNYRASVHEYVSKYPALREKEGYSLLEIDFEYEYKDAKMQLFSEWPHLSDFITKIVRQTNPDFLQNAAYTTAEKTLAVLMNIGHLFPVITALRKKKGQAEWRPSRMDCQEAFLMHVENPSLLREKLNQRKDKLRQHKLTLQPQPVVIGPVEKPTQFILVIDNFHYELESPMSLIDITFKAFHALHASYPIEAKPIWLFLQQAIYNIHTPYDGSYTSVTTRKGEYISEK